MPFSRYTMRVKRFPARTDRCLPPGAKRPARCTGWTRSTPNGLLTGATERARRPDTARGRKVPRLNGPGVRSASVEHQPEELTKEPQSTAPLEGALPAPSLGAALSARSLLSLQRSAGNAAVGALLPHAEEDESIERALARAAGHRANREPAAPPPFRSPSLLLRSKLRTLRAAARRDHLRRRVGHRQLRHRQGRRRRRDGAARPPSWRGADIKVRFKPNDFVDAEQIGLMQSVQSIVGGATNLTPGAAARPIKAADAKPINTGPGETDEGTAIDQSTTNTSPCTRSRTTRPRTHRGRRRAASARTASTSPTRQGRQGQDAWIFDKPRRAGARRTRGRSSR